MSELFGAGKLIRARRRLSTVGDCVWACLRCGTNCRLVCCVNGVHATPEEHTSRQFVPHRTHAQTQSPTAERRRRALISLSAPNSSDMLTPRRLHPRAPAGAHQACKQKYPARWTPAGALAHPARAALLGPCPAALPCADASACPALCIVECRSMQRNLKADKAQIGHLERQHASQNPVHMVNTVHAAWHKHAHPLQGPGTQARLVVCLRRAGRVIFPSARGTMRRAQAAPAP